MQALAPLFRSMTIVFLCIPFHTALSADPGGPTSSQPTPELLTAKIKQVETMTDLDAAI
ncbi:MAG: hypothetical protein GY731_08470, partial [Gammaproteobacteria bacterium]|nr:hypothetical protein [Gammaproteobacteria bacterium]